jgi:murein DD-endopeptidase MepM/ murein hydrolase activator NlpD
LDGLYEGREISQGTQLAEIGDEAVNGSWPPHLHFQVIRDMGGYRGDFPGVCKSSERAVYLQRCPDPNLILGIKQLGRSEAVVFIGMKTTALRKEYVCAFY